jgi:hypothetical protein
MKKILIILLVLLAFPVFAAEEQKKDDNFFIVVPVPMYSPETEWSGYLIMEYIFKLDRTDKITPSSTAQVSLSYTQLSQSDVYLEFSHYWKNSDYYLKVMLEYMKYPDRFYGIGNYERVTYDGLKGEPFTLEYEYAWVDFYKKIIADLHLGARYIIRRNVMLAPDPFKLVPWSEITGAKGGTDSGLGLIAKWDTRDNVNFSMSGDYAQAVLMFFGGILGGTSNFVKWDLDVRHYFKISDEHCVTAQVLLLAEAGKPPFYQMNMIGGDKLLRGYYEGGFRNRCLAAVQAEYKWIFIPRFVAEVNAGLGTVSDELTRLSASYILWSAGLGFHYIFDDTSKMTFRIDLGFGKDDSGVYIEAGEAF